MTAKNFHHKGTQGGGIADIARHRRNRKSKKPNLPFARFASFAVKFLLFNFRFLAISAILAILFLCVPSCPLSSSAFGPRKRMKIGFSTLWLKVYSSSEVLSCED
jgi:hypothetical protein